MSSHYRKLFTGILSITLVVLSLSVFVTNPSRAEAAECKVRNVVMIPSTNTSSLDNWYSESTRTQTLVKIGIFTNNCEGQDVFVSLVEGFITDTPVESLNKVSFKVPSNNQFKITMVPGVENNTLGCKLLPTCNYHVLVATNNGGVIYDSQDQNSLGKLSFKHSYDNASFSASDWDRLNDTSDNVNKNGECVVMGGQFDKTSLVFRNDNPPDVTMTFATHGCAGKKIYVSVYTPDYQDPTKKDGFLIPEIKNIELVVPETEKVTLTKTAGETHCTSDSLNIISGGKGCNYVLLAGAFKFEGNYFGGSIGNMFSSDNLPNGNLKYKCDGACTNSWGYGGGNEAVLVGNPFGDNNPACLDKNGTRIEDCYATYSGLSDALGTTGDGITAKFASVNTKDGLGGIINSIIAFGIGIGGVLAVAMIMYEGFLYMKEKKEGNVEKVSSAKTRITNTVLGFLLLLSIYVILRTINPELLNLTPRIDASNLDVQDRADNPDFVKNIDSIDDSNITLPPGDYSDESFLAYLAHQQGAGGAAAILWSAKKGKSTVPTTTPFTTGDIQKNIGTNCPSGCSKTPAGFVDYWRKKVAAAKGQGSAGIPPEIDDALKKASDDKGVDLATMRAMCRIESYTGCTRMAALSNHNSYGYAGLFQLSNSLYQKTSGVWEQYRKGTDSIIFNAYDNAYAAAGLMKYNIGQMKKYWSKINE